MANQIRFGMKFDVDKSGLNGLKNELQAIQKMTEQDLLKISPGTNLQDAKNQLTQIKQSAGEIQQALNRAFNRELGTVNITKFNNELKKLDINKIYKDLNSVGTAGRIAFRNTATEVLTTNMQLKQTHKLLDDMATSMANTVKWGITSSIFNNITNSIQKAWTYTKSLDTSLNDIRIVTDKSADSMTKFAVQANKAAKELGASTRDYTEASLIYYQQGLSDEETRARTETTLKAANVTGQKGEEVSEQLTAIWNGYKVSAEEAELYIDKVAAVAAATAADLEELSTGMGKVASAANTMGVNVDQMNALLATAVSVTREAPETIGTSFRSIFSRMGQLKSDGTDEFGVTLGKVTTQLQSMGIEILDQQGNMRDMGTVITEVGEKWQGWTQAQKVAAAQAMAGTQQYSRLMAVFENWDMYKDALETSMDASGTLENQQATYMESMAAHQQQLSTSIERVYDSLFNADSFEKVLDTLTWVTDRIGDLIDGLGGGGNAFLALGSIAMKVFDTQISRGIATTINNINALKENTNKLSAQMETVKLFEGKKVNDEYFQTLVKMKEEVLSYGNIVSEVEHNQANDIIKATNSLQNQADAWKENLEEIDKYLLQFETLKEYTLDVPVVSTKKDEKGQEYQVTETQETFQLEGIDATSDRYKGIMQALNETEAEMKKAATETKDYDKVLKKLVGTVDKVSLASEEAGVNLEGFTEAEEEEIQVFDELKGVANKYIETAKDVQSLDATSINQKLELANAINEYNMALESGDALAVAEKVNNLSNVIKKVAGEVTSTTTNTRKHIEKESEGESAHLQNEINEIEKRWNDFINNLSLVQKINAVTDIVSGLGQVASGITSIINLTDVWNDQDLTFGEKLTQTLTTLSFVLPSMINGVTSVGKGIEKLGPLLSKTAIGAKLTGTALGSTATAATGAGAAAGGAAAGAAGLAATLGLVAVAVAAVVAAIWLCVKAYNADADAAKEAAERAEEQRKAYEKLKESYDNLKDSLEDYQDAEDALSKLKQGTIEWKNAVIDLNQKVLELMQTYPQLAQYITSENGILKLTDEGITKIVTEQQASVVASSIATQRAKSEANEKQTTSDITDMGRKLGAEIDAKIVENVLNALETTPDLLTKTGDDRYNEGIMAAIGFYGYEDVSYDDDTKLDLVPVKARNMIDELYKYQNDIYALSNDIASRKSENKIYEKQMISDYYGLAGGADIYQGSKYQDAISAIAAQQLDLANTGKKNYEEGGYVNSEGKYVYYKDTFGLWDNEATDEEILKRYAEIKGYDVSKTKDEWWNEGTFYNKDGTLAEEKVSGEEIRKYVAQMDALERRVSSVDAIAAEVNTMALLGNMKGEGIGDLMVNNLRKDALTFEGITNEQYEILQKELEAGTLIQSDRDAQLLNYENKAEAEKMIGAGLSDYDPSIATRQKAIEEEAEFKAALADTAEELDVSTEALESYSEFLEDTNENLKDNKKATLEVAKQCFNFAQGVSDLGDALDDNWQLLEDWKNGLTNSTEAYEAVGTVQAAIEKMFGVQVSNDFVKEHLTELKDLANGSTEALDELQVAAAKDYLVSLNLDENSLATVESITDQLTSQDIEIGTSLNDENIIKGLQNILDTGAMTADEMQSYLNALGYSPDIKWKTVDSEPQTTTTDTTVSANIFGNEVQVAKLHSVSSSKTQTQVPYIAAEGTDNPAEGTESGSGLTRTTNTSTLANAVKNSGQSGKKVTPKGSGSKKDPKEKDLQEDEKDRYHDIDILLKNIENDFDVLEKKKSKLFGADLINNMNQQLKLLSEQADVLKKKIEESKEESDELKTKLSDKGITFNEDGTIANYESAYDAQLAYVNEIIDKYNKMDAESQEKFEKTVENAEKDFEKFKENIQRYEEVITSQIPGLEAAIEDAFNQEIEIKIEKFNMEIETRLDMSQAERDWNEFKKKVIDNIDDDDILGNAKANLEDFSSYYKDNFEGVIQVNTDHVNDILFELNEMDKGLASKYYGDNRTKALEDLKTYYTQLMDDLTAVEELSEEIRQSYLDMMDEAQEKFDEQISTYEQITDLIDHDIKLIELLNGEKSYSEFGEYYNKLEANNNKQLDFQRQQVEFWKAQMDSADEGSERWEKAKENWTAAVTDWRSLVNESIENLQNKYLNTISEIFEKLNNEVTNGLGLEYVNEEWNLINKNAEEYLDTINAMYGIQELSNKYLDAIDQTDSISAQRELNELMEQEIAALEEKDKLTQYDIDRANMRYNIALKQIALEEAQQNKTSMRLKRDSQGNYSYQFIADEDAVGKAEDELAAAQNELYNFDKENYINNLDELYAAYEEYQQKMFEAAQINDPDERAQRELLINEQYGELINGLVEQNQTIRSNLHESAFDELARLYDTDVENYRRMSEEERNILLNEMIPQWTSGVQQMADTFAGEGGLGEVCKESLAEISQATEDYKTDLEEVEDAAGLTFEEIISGTDDAIIETEDLLDVNDELIEQYEDELDAIDAVIDELDKLIERFEKAKQAAIDASKEAYEYFQSADDDMADEAFKDRDYSRDMMRAVIAGYSTEDKHYKDLETRRTKKLGNTKPEVDNNRLKNLFEAYRAGNSEAIFVVTEVANGNKHFTNQFLLDHGFKTGGYTGNWIGEDGRLAFLHQKELVLNAEDTQNVLGAVKILRNITDLIGNSVIRKAAAMSGNITTPQGGNITNETLEQDVHIDAHFPNVTNSREIENALDNLMNKASQRALRKR